MQTRTFRWSLTSWSMIAFYAVCGLLLLLLPNLALMIANYALATILCAVGIAMIVGYVRAEAMDGIFSYGLAFGLILALLGAVLFIKSDILITLLPFVWGVAMIAGGFGKFQIAFDLKRIRQDKWWVLLIGALISFVLGIISVTNPAFLATTATMFAGIALLAEAVLDCSALLTIKREIRHLKVQSGVR